jgi:hypothetical protein
MDIKKTIEKISINVDSIKDPMLQSIFTQLLNVIEFQTAKIKELEEENQKLRDENNRLKGEQGKPTIRKQTDGNRNISSEAERNRKNKQKKKRSKNKNRMSINRIEICKIDKNQLPADAFFKGYQSVIVQDIIIQPDNIKFKKEIYYSASLKQTFVATLPPGYHGDYGPGVKALILDMHHNSKTTESAIHRFLQNHEIDISTATISRILTDNHEEFHLEKNEIVQAGLASTIHQQMDDTKARVNGKNYHTHILCNSFYTAYFTRPGKDRLTIIEILTFGEIFFHLNESSYALMEKMKLSKKRLNILKQCQPKEIMNRGEIDLFLSELFPNPKKHQTNRRIILEASAIIAYQRLPYAIPLLLTDDAPQFKQITDLLALCWIHDGRHYKKLEPVIPIHRDQLNHFLDQYWIFYHKLHEYKQSPTTELATLLSNEFDILFSTKTGYDQLDERIEKTKIKKESLLLVLKYPDLPLHNNASELGARTQARYRDISFHTINKKGTEAKDTFMTIVETAKKSAVNSYQYLRDRISKKLQMPSLASLIQSSGKSLAI